MQLRIRNIRPTFFSSAQVASVSPLARILFQGLWAVADREGRLLEKPRRLKSVLLPYDDCDIVELLDELAAARDESDGTPLVIRYQVDGQQLIYLPGFTEHQTINSRERTSTLPACPEPVIAQARTCRHVQAHAHTGLHKGEGEGEGGGSGSSPTLPPSTTTTPGAPHDETSPHEDETHDEEATVAGNGHLTHQQQAIQRVIAAWEHHNHEREERGDPPRRVPKPGTIAGMLKNLGGLQEIETLMDLVRRGVRTGKLTQPWLFGQIKGHRKAQDRSGAGDRSRSSPAARGSGPRPAGYDDSRREDISRIAQEARERAGRA